MPTQQNCWENNDVHVKITWWLVWYSSTDRRGKNKLLVHVFQNLVRVKSWYDWSYQSESWTSLNSKRTVAVIRAGSFQDLANQWLLKYDLHLARAFIRKLQHYMIRTTWMERINRQEIDSRHDLLVKSYAKVHCPLKRIIVLERKKF